MEQLKQSWVHCAIDVARFQTDLHLVSFVGRRTLRIASRLLLLTASLPGRITWPGYATVLSEKEHFDVFRFTATF